MSADPEKARERSRRWRAAHLEEARRRGRERYRRRRAADPEEARERDRERGRRYRAANREKLNERAREQRRRWRAAHPKEARERDRERSRRYRAANPEKLRESGRKQARRYRAANPEKVREIGRRYRVTHRSNGLRPEEWAALWAARDGCCWLCGDPLPDDPNACEIVVDHDHRCCGPKSSCPSCRRSLAHSRCNTAIGLIGEDPAKLRRIADSLEDDQRKRRMLPAESVLFNVAAEPPAPRPRPSPNGHRRSNTDPDQWEEFTLW